MQRNTNDWRSLRCLGNDLHHSLILTYAVPPFISEFHELLQNFERIDDYACIDCTSLRVQLVDELRDDSKITASTTNAPEQLGILGFAGCQNFPFAVDYCRLMSRYFEAKNKSGMFVDIPGQGYRLPFRVYH